MRVAHVYLLAVFIPSAYRITYRRNSFSQSIFNSIMGAFHEENNHCVWRTNAHIWYLYLSDSLTGRFSASSILSWPKIKNLFTRIIEISDLIRPDPYQRSVFFSGATKKMSAFLFGPCLATNVFSCTYHRAQSSPHGRSRTICKWTRKNQCSTPSTTATYAMCEHTHKPQTLIPIKTIIRFSSTPSRLYLLQYYTNQPTRKTCDDNFSFS